MRLCALACLAACSAPPPAPQRDFPEAWVATVVRQPARFEELLLQTNREGWVALHAHDGQQAWAAFAGPTPIVRRSRARASWELGRLHETLGGLHVAVEGTYAQEAGARLPDADTLAHTSTVALGCDDAAGLEALGHRASIHADALAKRDPSVLLSVAKTPLTTGSHPWFDPCVHTTLATLWDARGLEDLDATRWSESSAWVDGGLESGLFAAWRDGAALRSALDTGASPGSFGFSASSSNAMGIPARIPGNADAARAEVRALDDLLHDWRQRLHDVAPPEGVALEDELALFARYRQEWLLARATVALEDEQPHEALLILEMARDVTEREVGPRNSPRLFALLAAARFATGRDREALDALHPLSARYPEVLGLRERLGDLTVLRGLTRTGDSKEN